MPRLTPVSWQTLEKVFTRAGFKYVRTKGDHMSFEKEGCLRPVVIPKYKEIGVDIIKSNMRNAKMSREDYFKYLNSGK
ncbi:MAG: type II toxin-antitoxin system HicA family toxin [Nitrospinota bacterium]|nr:type II toxin-antitoxin system HicA family toxin [Nitrospinota bacterium]